MKARIAVLTTQTTHHAQFLDRLAEYHEIVQVVLENKETTINYEIHARLDQLVDDYEQKLWFDGKEPIIQDIYPTVNVTSCNDPDSVKAITKAKPDLIFSFGVGRVGVELLSLYPKRYINIQATDTEHYAGLDTMYWACFHGDFNHLSACLNLIEPERQQGAKILKYQYTPTVDSEVIHLRSVFTNRSIDAALDIVSMHQHFDQFINQPQIYNGRFYYFIPAVLKDLIENKYSTYLQKFWNNR